MSRFINVVPGVGVRPPEPGGGRKEDVTHATLSGRQAELWIRRLTAKRAAREQVILVEASKQIYAKPTMVRVPRRRLVYTPAPHGL